MLTVDITDVPEATIGSPVVLWGEGLPVDDVAAAASTVGYQLLCAVAPRVPFVTTEVGTVDIEL
jgi:alanine racemase